MAGLVSNITIDNAAATLSHAINMHTTLPIMCGTEQFVHNWSLASRSPENWHVHLVRWVANGHVLHLTQKFRVARFPRSVAVKTVGRSPSDGWSVTVGQLNTTLNVRPLTVWRHDGIGRQRWRHGPGSTVLCSHGWAATRSNAVLLARVHSIKRCHAITRSRETKAVCVRRWWVVGYRR